MAVSNTDGLEIQAIEEHTCVRMGAVAILTECRQCGKTTVGIILADQPDYYATECKHCGNSTVAPIHDPLPDDQR
jgi:hypothetical protein